MPLFQDIKWPNFYIMYSEYDSISQTQRQNIVLVPTAKGDTVAIMANGLSNPTRTIRVGGDMQMFASATSAPMEEDDPENGSNLMDQYAFQFYMGSLTVVGLFILFRFIQKT